MPDNHALKLIRIAHCLSVDFPFFRDQIRLAVTLALYDNYLKLPSNWKRADANSDILNYNGPKNVCSEGGRQLQEEGNGDEWQLYLDQKSLAVLS